MLYYCIFISNSVCSVMSPGYLEISNVENNYIAEISCCYKPELVVCEFFCVPPVVKGQHRSGSTLFGSLYYFCEHWALSDSAIAVYVSNPGCYCNPTLITIIGPTLFQSGALTLGISYVKLCANTLSEFSSVGTSPTVIFGMRRRAMLSFSAMFV